MQHRSPHVHRPVEQSQRRGRKHHHQTHSSGNLPQLNVDAAMGVGTGPNLGVGTFNSTPTSTNELPPHNPSGVNNQPSYGTTKYSAQPVQLTTWAHDHQTSEEAVHVSLNLLPVGANEGDVIEIRRIEADGKGDTKLGPKYYFVVKPLNDELAKISPPIHISLKTGQIQNTIGVPSRGKVQVRLRMPSDVEADMLEIKFKDTYLTRADMWRISSEMTGKCFFRDETITYCEVIRLSINEIYQNGKKVLSGYVGPNTRVVYRCDSSRLVFFIQMSAEMWHFEEQGHIIFHKMTNSFFPEVFKRWRKQDSHHVVTIILFTSVDISGNNGSLQHGEVAHDTRDYFRVVVDQIDINNWGEIMEKLRYEFARFERDVLLQDNGKIVGKILPANKGNILQAINITTKLVSGKFRDRDLRRTGVQALIVTPGTGLFDVDYELLYQTSSKLTNIEIGVDLICLGRPPLHVTPLFRYKRDGQIRHCVPSWLDISFWSSNERHGVQWTPRCKIYEIQMMGVMENEASSIMIDYLPAPSGNKTATAIMDDYDRGAFGVVKVKEEEPDESFSGMSYAPRMVDSPKEVSPALQTIVQMNVPSSTEFGLDNGHDYNGSESGETSPIVPGEIFGEIIKPKPKSTLTSLFSTLNKVSAANISGSGTNAPTSPVLSAIGTIKSIASRDTIGEKKGGFLARVSSISTLRSFYHRDEDTNTTISNISGTDSSKHTSTPDFRPVDRPPSSIMEQPLEELASDSILIKKNSSQSNSKSTNLATSPSNSSSVFSHSKAGTMTGIGTHPDVHLNPNNPDIINSNQSVTNQDSHIKAFDQFGNIQHTNTSTAVGVVSGAPISTTSTAGILRSAQQMPLVINSNHDTSSQDPLQGITATPPIPVPIPSFGASMTTGSSKFAPIISHRRDFSNLDSKGKIEEISNPLQKSVISEIPTLESTFSTDTSDPQIPNYLLNLLNNEVRKPPPNPPNPPAKPVLQRKATFAGNNPDRFPTSNPRPPVQGPVQEPFGKLTGVNRLNNITTFPHAQAMPIANSRRPASNPQTVASGSTSNPHTHTQTPGPTNLYGTHQKRSTRQPPEIDEDEEEHSMWMTIENPSNVPHDRIANISNYGRWQYVYPKRIKRHIVKWRSLISPAALPLLTSNFPSLRQFDNDYTTQVYDAILFIGNAEYGSMSELLNEMVAIRISMGFQIVAKAKVAYVEAQHFSGSPDSVIEIVQTDVRGKKIYMTLENQIHRISFENESGNSISVKVYTKKPQKLEFPEGGKGKHYKLGSDSRPSSKSERNYYPLVKTRYETSYTPNSVDLFDVPPPLNWNQIDQILTGYEEYILDDPRMYRMRYVLVPVDIPNRSFEDSKDEALTSEEIRLEGLRELSVHLQKGKYYTPDELRVKNNQKMEDAWVPEIKYYTGDLGTFLLSIYDNIGPYDQIISKDGQIGMGSIRKNPLFAQPTERFNRSIRMSQLSSELLSKNGIRFMNRRWHLKMHYHCFIGTDLVIWLLSNFLDIKTVEDAINYGNHLMDQGLFHHVEDRHSFLNGHYFYQLAPEYDEQRSLSSIFSPISFKKQTSSSGDSSIPKNRGRISSTTSLKDLAPNHQRSGSSHEFVSASPALLGQSKNPSPGLHALQEKDGSSGLNQKGPHSNLKPKVFLTRSMRYNVDPAVNKKSTRPEILTIHMDQIHNPENCFQLRFEWLNTTPKFIDDAIAYINKLTARYGLKLAQIPLEEITQLPKSNTFCSLFKQTMAIDPASIVREKQQYWQQQQKQIEKSQELLAVAVEESKEEDEENMDDSSILTSNGTSSKDSENDNEDKESHESANSNQKELDVNTAPTFRSLRLSSTTSLNSTTPTISSLSGATNTNISNGHNSNRSSFYHNRLNSTIPSSTGINVIPEALSEDPLYYHKYVLKKLDYFHDTGPLPQALTDRMDVEFSWGKPTYKYFQSVHKSGLCIAQVLDDGEFVLMVNSLAVNRVDPGTYRSARKDEVDSTVDSAIGSAGSGVAGPSVSASAGTPGLGPIQESSSRPETPNQENPEKLLDEFRELCEDEKRLAELFDRATNDWINKHRPDSTGSIGSGGDSVFEYGHNNANFGNTVAAAMTGGAADSGPSSDSSPYFNSQG